MAGVEDREGPGKGSLEPGSSLASSSFLPWEKGAQKGVGGGGNLITPGPEMGVGEA